MEQKSWYLKHADLFTHLPKEAHAELERICSKRRIRKKEVVFPAPGQDERIFLVQEGEVEIVKLSPRRRRVVIEVLGPGDVFGDITFSPEVLRGTFAEALPGAVICSIGKVDFLALIRRFPDVSVEVIRDLAYRLEETESKVRDLASERAGVRLINELLRLARKRGEETDTTLTLPKHISHEKIAEMIGTTRETVTRLLGDLEDKEFISIGKDRRIVIHKDRISEPL